MLKERLMAYIRTHDEHLIDIIAHQVVQKAVPIRHHRKAAHCTPRAFFVQKHNPF